MNAQLHHGDCREILATLPDASVHAIVTDPPYELGFMGRAWDSTGVAYDPTLWAECLRVLTPGGHLLSFGATRTYHRMAAAIEDAGFEIRDSIHWIYGSGFPKSLDVSKAIDKAAGHWRGKAGAVASANGSMGGPNYERTDKGEAVTAAAAAAAGWGTALKPAHEPIVLARKPLIGTVADNVQTHGTGALNIDATRVGHDGRIANASGGGQGAGYEAHNYVGRKYGNGIGGVVAEPHAAGRWPANVILDEDAAAGNEWARYFYCAKASRRERDAGLDHMPERARPTMGNGIGGQGEQDRENNRNIHPTVKPLALMRYLVRLVTPPGGTVLEPFAGSGTTMAAAILEGFDVIGCEMTDDYLPIIRGRVAWAHEEREREDNEPKTLFEGDAA